MTQNNTVRETPPPVSIVMPTYNVEEYLQQSLDSVINQTYDNLEIICVDDGSTDRSGEMLEQYKMKDPRIQVIHQKNQGAGPARNAGLAKATGKYIIFWDPDDYFDLNAIKLMVEKAEQENADLCVCDAQHFYSDTGELTAHSYIVPPYPKKSTFSWRDCPEHIFFVASSAPWNKLVLLSLIQANDIRFPDVPYLNDNEYMFLVMCYANRITLCKEKLVYYRMDRPNSLVQKADNGSKNVISIFRQCFDELNRRNLLEDPALKHCFFKKTASMYHYRIRYCSSYEDYKKLYDQFFSPVSPLSEYDASYETINRIEDIKNLSAGDYLLKLYKSIQQANDLKQQRLSTSKKTISNLKIKNEKLQQKNKKISEKNERLKLKIKAIESSHSFKIGKAITSVPRKLRK